MEFGHLFHIKTPILFYFSSFSAKERIEIVGTTLEVDLSLNKLSRWQVVKTVHQGEFMETESITDTFSLD